MTVLEDALFDLAEHLDHPAGDDLEATVLRTIREPAPADATHVLERASTGSRETSAPQ